MASMEIDILNPKAEKLLKNLADLKLISIKERKTDDFLKFVQILRQKAKDNPTTLEEITKEVESVRTKRYGKAKR